MFISLLSPLKWSLTQEIVCPFRKYQWQQLLENDIHLVDLNLEDIGSVNVTLILRATLSLNGNC